VPRAGLEQAYPGVAFRPRTRNWWARLTRVPAECVHLETEQGWMALFVPDLVYLQGRPVVARRPVRPEISLCRNCLAALLEPELAGYRGRVVALEPDGATFSQYFFVAMSDFAAAGLEVAVAQAIQCRLEEPAGSCEECSEAARWLWIGRDEVASLDEVARIERARGRRLCPRHGAQALCTCFERVGQANLFYVNVPYGTAGAYLWI
jgi:hypothetical protein